jgi:hypothetical protein
MSLAAPSLAPLLARLLTALWDQGISNSQSVPFSQRAFICISWPV